MNKRLLLIISLISFLSSFATGARSQGVADNPVDLIADQIAQDLQAKKTITSIGVINFSDLDGRATTAGKYISEEFSNALAGKAQGMQVIDRNYLNGIVSQNNLFAHGMVPDEVKKLGTMAATGAIATGTVVPLGDSIKLTVKIISTENGAIVTTKQASIPRTEDINMLLASDTPGQPAPAQGGAAQTAPAQETASTPAAATSSSAPQPSPENPPIEIEKGGIHGRISQCTLTAGDQLVCSVILTNTQDDSITTPFCASMGSYCAAKGTERPSMIYGDDGTPYPTVLAIGNEVIDDSRTQSDITLLPGVPLKVDVATEKVNAGIKTATVRISCGRGDGFPTSKVIEDFIFKNVPVVRE